MTQNPLFQPLPEKNLGIPSFDTYQVEDFQEAFQVAISSHRDEIERITVNKSLPTFENTIAAMDASGQTLQFISLVFFNLNSAHTNKKMQELAKKISPMLAEWNDELYMNERLFQKVKRVYDAQKRLNLTQEQKQLLNRIYKNFIRAGVQLSNDKKEQLKAINQRLSVLSVEFGNRVLAENNAFELVIDHPQDLSGLPEGVRQAAQEEAQKRGKPAGSFVFTLHNASVMPFLTYADNRKLREQIWNAYQLRGNHDDANDTKDIIKEILQLRKEKAKLLGYPDYAAYVLEERMVKNTKKVYDFLNQLWPAALRNAQLEEKELLALAQKDGITELKPWDWRYYAEKLRQKKFQLSEQEISKYFVLENIRECIFELCNKLYGLKFIPFPEAPKYHPEVSVYKVMDGQNLLGVLMMDFFPRESKRGGAWMTSYRIQSMEEGKRIWPVVSIVCNFTKPTSDSPSLLTIDEVQTFFHEFGHALHGLFSNVNYRMLAGTSVPTDFVELPSQIMENWAAEPEVIRPFAKHYQTGAVIPDSILETLKKSVQYGQGFATTEYLAAAFLDMDFHTKYNGEDILEFEQASMQRLGLISSIIPRYRSTYFQHIFSSGYAAGYYSYIWSEMLDSDAFEVFKQKGLYHQTSALSFRKNILEKGGSDEPEVLYKKYRGRNPSIEPLLKKRGLR